MQAPKAARAKESSAQSLKAELERQRDQQQVEGVLDRVDGPATSGVPRPAYGFHWGKRPCRSSSATYSLMAGGSGRCRGGGAAPRARKAGAKKSARTTARERRAGAGASAGGGGPAMPGSAIQRAGRAGCPSRAARRTKVSSSVLAVGPEESSRPPAASSRPAAWLAASTEAG